jgi:arabinose-5-phosphate isomerase
MNSYAIDVFKEEAKAIHNLISLLDDNFAGVVNEILSSEGRVIVTGIGKSGIIGKKISSSLASTGTPSFFLHPAEAFHGDLGMIKPIDVIIAITNSGETDEILKLVPFIKDNGNKLVAITGNPVSTLAKNSDYHLNIHVEREVCPLNLAPTTSAMTTLAMGDALVVALMKERNFQPNDYARYHPGGDLGRRLLTKAKDIMRFNNLPIVDKFMAISDVMIEISKARLGLAVVVDNDMILGVITDGDIRRQMEKNKSHFFDTIAKDIMNTTPKKVLYDQPIVEIEEIMRKNQIHTLLVVDVNDRLLGVIGYQDLN